MNPIQSTLRLRSTGTNFSPQGYVVVLALTALAGFVYYLLQKQLSLSPRAQAIRNSFTHLPHTMSAWDLIKLAREVERVQNIYQASTTERFQVKISPAFYSLQKAKLFIVEMRKDHTWRVQYIERPLGRGSFGKVIQLFDLQSGHQTALKMAIPSKQNKYDRGSVKRANDELEKEHRNLMWVHKDIQPFGVQDKPLSDILRIRKLYSCQIAEHLAYEGTVYNGSLDNLILQKLPLKLRLAIVIRVLLGMDTLRAKKLIGHDLKLENILYRQGPDKLEVHISDLGGATHESELRHELKAGLARTPGLADETSIGVAKKVPIEMFQRHVVRNSEKCSIGLALLSILIGQLVNLESPLEEMWTRAQLPLEGDYGELFSALKSFIGTGLWDGLFKGNIDQLAEMVLALHNKTSNPCS